MLHVAAMVVALAIQAHTTPPPQPSPSPSPCDPKGPNRRMSGFGRTWEAPPCSGGGVSVMGQASAPVEPLWQRRSRLLQRYLFAVRNATRNPRQYMLTPPGRGVAECDYCWPLASGYSPFAQFGNAWISYDEKSGNYYVLQRNWDGTYQLDGENLNTGAQWLTIYYPDGHMTGVNKNAVKWEYSPEDCYYSNSLGEECAGCAEERACN